MKKLMLIVAAVTILATLGVGVALAGQGNGLPGGQHFNLNIIGAPKDKNPDATGWSDPERHTIMVDLNGKVNIYMTQGDNFAVIDANGTDGIARFQLGSGKYDVYAVALGKPAKSVTITPQAAFDGQTGEEVFYLGSVTLSHNKQPKWQKVTGLFEVTVTVTTADGVSTIYNNAWVFSIPELIEYWWEYDNSGLKLTQVRFYKVD